MQKNINLFTAVFAFFLGVLILGGVVLFKNVNNLIAHRGRVEHSQRVLMIVQNSLSNIADAEAGFRGYLITGQEVYLEPYNRVLKEIPEKLSRLTRLVSDNPEQEARAQEFSQNIRSRLDEMESVIILKRENANAEIRNWLRSGLGKARLDEIRGVQEAFVKSEAELLDFRRSEAQQSETLLRYILGAFVVTSFLLAVAAYLLIRRNFALQAEENWIRGAQIEVSQRLQNLRSGKEIATKFLTFVSEYLSGQGGILFGVENGTLKQIGALGLAENASLDDNISNAAKRCFQQSKALTIKSKEFDSFLLNTSFGNLKPKQIWTTPLIFEGDVVAVLEVGLNHDLTPRELNLVERVLPTAASAIATERSRLLVQELLEETQRQSEELTTQQEELRVSNEELQKHTQDLSRSRDKLQIQQEELIKINEELENQTKEVEQASRYKSEFLANMSHELRTPLNSILILASLLGENRERHLNEKELEYARSIKSSGTDLLNLINDILDLSKVEAGKLDIIMEEIEISDILRSLRTLFEPLAMQKNVKFFVEKSADTPATIVTDQHRLEQVLKNFVSNAIKFTEHGHVKIATAKKDDSLIISVTDTGVGIPVEKREKIFDAFTQADGSTSRKFGGTGLGLTISRELTNLLGGRIQLESEVGQGSTFSLILPLLRQSKPIEKPSQVSTPISKSNSPERGLDLTKKTDSRPKSVFLDDDRNGIQPFDKVLLIVEDDLSFAKLLMQFGRDAKFKVIAAHSVHAAEQELAWCAPAAIILDIKLPDASGLSLLERLKANPKTRHIPVHLMSALDDAEAAFKLGAIGYLTKPVEADELRAALSKLENVFSHNIRNVLIVEDEKIQSEHIRSLVSMPNVSVDTAENAKQALERLKSVSYDCMILDLRLPDMTGLELLEKLHSGGFEKLPPVIVYTAKELTFEEEAKIRKYSESIILKGAKSPERLLDEVTLFLHRVFSDLSSEHQQMIQQLSMQEKIFENRTVLIADDDLRNVFALASALEARGLRVKVARDGFEAVEMASTDKSIDLILMDVMMPGMDGLEATRTIRADKSIRRLPIVSLTAKAMKGDQDKCFEAGANDYLSKPVDLERLVSVLKVWLPKKDGL